MNQQLLTRFASSIPSSINTTARTCQAVISSPQPVERFDGKGRFYEVLLPSGLDRQAFNNRNVPILDSHNQFTVNALLGTVEAVRVENNQVIADLKFSGSADVTSTFEKIADGTLKGVSVGYRILEARNRNQGGKRIVEALRWQIIELSCVTFPADSNSQFRSNQNYGGFQMDPSQNSNFNGQNNQDGFQSQTNSNSQGQPTEADRTQIRFMAKQLKIDTRIADDLINVGASIEHARETFLDLWKQNQVDQRQRSSKLEVEQLNSDPSAMQRRMIKGLANRMGVPLDAGDKEASAVREFADKRIDALAMDWLQVRGENMQGITPSNVFTQKRAALTTSDFPKLLEESGNRVFLGSYTASESGLKQICVRRDLRDFKTIDTLRLSELAPLPKLNEEGEIRQLPRREAFEPIKLETFAGQVKLSRALMVNDDLGAFSMELQTLGQSAALREAEDLASLLNNGTTTTLQDGHPVFELSTARSGKGRGNITGGSVLNVAYDLGGPRLALRQRKSLDGRTVLGLKPMWLVVSSNLETIGEKLLADLYPADVEKANPFSNGLTLLVDNYLTDDSAYLVASPSMAPTICYSYRTSSPGPEFRRDEDFNTLGMSWSVVLDWSAKFIDFRGIQKLAA
ncbi:MAG: hypothetical protein F4Z31_06200 [Gemmatimonadetes bacterium]|nr:hypothetical protein [Gemmatimonadota bacterium]